MINLSSDFLAEEEEELEDELVAGGGLVEIGREACWSLSSAKPGFGIEQLRDDNLDTYWQHVPLCTLFPPRFALDVHRFFSAQV